MSELHGDFLRRDGIHTDTYRLPDDWDGETIRPGDLFDTKYETRCRVLSRPDEYGSFDALDSEGVVCSFGVSMVVKMWTAEKQPSS